jgi:hypothetical protein
MVKASKKSKPRRAPKPNAASVVRADLALAFDERRDLQRLNRQQREIGMLAKQLARRIKWADAGLLELGATLMERASKLAKRRDAAPPAPAAAAAVHAPVEHHQV